MRLLILGILVLYQIAVWVRLVVGIAGNLILFPIAALAAVECVMAVLAGGEARLWEMNIRRGELPMSVPHQPEKGKLPKQK
jgi:hypothetical protein